MVLLALALLAGCSWFSGGDGEKPSPLVEFEAAAQADELWSVSAGKGPGKRFLKLVPAQHNDILYVCDTRGRVTAIQQGSGDQRWRVDTKSELTAGVGYGDDRVLVATSKGEVIALHKDDGHELWRARVSSEVLAPPVADQGVVVVQSVDGRLTAFAAENGKQLWTVDRSEPPLSLRGTATPVIVPGAVITGLASGKLMAVTLREGQVVWEIPVAQAQGRTEIERLIDVDVPPLVIGRTLFAAAYQGKIVAINLENGRLLWSRELSTHSELGSDRANLYVSDTRGHVVALDIGTGATVWKQEKLAGRRPGAPVIVGQTVAVGDFDGYLHWLSRDDGRFIARHRVASSALLTPPLVDGATLFVTDQGGDLTAVEFGALSR
jgi:outer membrane protein assembly factor BamB